MTYARKTLVSLNDTPYYWWQLAPAFATISTIHGGHTSSRVAFAASGCGASMSTPAAITRIARNGCWSAWRS